MALSSFKWILGIVLLFWRVSATSPRTEQSKNINSTHFDYVILGGGTAGLVVASRLSEDPQTTVAVIEAGNFERNNPNVTSTTGLGIGKDTDVDWQYESAPQIYASNQSVIWSAGKGVGGSSLINGKSSYGRAGADADWKPQE